MPRDLTPIHPELREAARTFPKIPFARWNLRFFRLLFKLQPAGKIPPEVRLTQTTTPGHDGHPVQLRIYSPVTRTTPAPAMVWIHGGGFIVGSAGMNDGVLARFVRETGIVIISVEYRLAPRYPFPTPLEDCYTALRWTHDSAQPLGIDPDRIAIGGQSAGGGLAACLVQLAQDRDEIHPAFQLLIYPMLDDHSTLRTDIPHPELLTWTQANNRLGWECYLQQPVGSPAAPPHAIAARRTDLKGLPPAWTGVGTLDLFHDEDVAYGERLKAAGVECELMVIPGAYHGFDVLDTDLPLVQQFEQAQIAALKRHLFS